MGALVKMIDAVLGVFFTIMTVVPFIIVAQVYLPQSLFTGLRVDLHNWYIRTFDGYLFVEKPHFTVGSRWLELVAQGPFALVNLYGLCAAKSWFKGNCIIYGASFSTIMVLGVAELRGSGKASDRMFRSYVLVLGLGILVLLRGLLPSAHTTSAAPNRGNGRRVLGEKEN